jgi:hypothetical protein
MIKNQPPSPDIAINVHSRQRANRGRNIINGHVRLEVEPDQYWPETNGLTNNPIKTSLISAAHGVVPC